MTKKYIVRLTNEERSELEQLINTGKTSSYKRFHAQILLKADISQEGAGWNDNTLYNGFGGGRFRSAR